MFAKLNSRRASAASLCIAMSFMTTGASAISVELAKKCDNLTAKAYPPRVIGNPAAGSAKGSAQAQRDYFRKCVANDGKVDDNAAKPAK
jgi:hypothetical protein